MASTTLPAASAFTGAAVTEGAFKTAITDLRTMINEVLGDNSTGTQGAKAGFVMLGSAYINDNSNANATIGLTINQGGNDDEILALKSSDVAHGMTSIRETDTFGGGAKLAATTGGLFLYGLGSGVGGLSLNGYHTTDTADRTTAASGAVLINGLLKSGTSAGGLGANANILVVRTGSTTRFILDSDGDSHQDVGTAWTNFDAHEDVALLHALSVHVSKKGDPIKREFGKFVKVNRRKLEELRLVKFNRDGHHFVNMSRLTMLLTGAMRQLGERFASAWAEVGELRESVTLLTNRMQRLEAKGVA